MQTASIASAAVLALLLALCGNSGVGATELIAEETRLAAGVALEPSAKMAALERFVKRVRPLCSASTDAGVANTLFAIDVLMHRRGASDALDQQISGFINLLEKDPATTARGQTQRLRLTTLQGAASANLQRGFNELLQTVDRSGRDSIFSSEISFYFTQSCIAIGNIERAKEAFGHAEQLRRASRYPETYNGILTDKDYRELAATLHDLDQSESAQDKRWKEAEQARFTGAWRQAANAYAWVAGVAVDPVRKHDALWRAYQCMASDDNRRPNKCPSMEGLSLSVQEQRAPLRASVQTEISLMVEYDLADGEKQAVSGLASFGAMGAKGKTLGLSPTAPAVEGDDVFLLAELYDRLAICRMVQGDYDLAGECLAREVVIRPPGKRPDGRINALDDLQTMCAGKRMPVVMPHLVMNGQPRVQLLLFLGGFQMYRGDVKDARRLYQLVEGDKGASETQIIYAHYEQAEITRLDGALKEACDQWDAIAKAAPRSLYAAKSLADAAQTFAGMGQITNCETRFMRVLSEYADYPERHRVLYNLGFLYFFTKDYRKAEVMFKDLVRQYPTTWEAQRVKRVELPAIAADHNPPPTK